MGICVEVQVLGAIAGDVIGSVYEWHNTKSLDFELFSEQSRFTDDTVLTVAVADSILSGAPLVELLRQYVLAYPRRGYGGYFRKWVESGSTSPYGSWGNGASMRVSPVGFAYPTLEETIARAAESAAVTHNHEQAVTAACAVAAAIFLARTGVRRHEIQRELETRFGYDLSVSLEEIRPSYTFDVSSAGSVPQALRAFLESTSFEDAIRRAVSIGGDSDTIACITGGVAHAAYGTVPPEIRSAVLARLDPRMIEVVEAFSQRYGVSA